MEGYIKLYRKLMESPVWDDPNYLKLWMFCLMKASHKKREILIGNQTVTLHPGEFVLGRKTLTDEMNKGMKPKFRQSEISWWRYLNNLQNLEMLNIKKTNKYSVVSISKWNQYQLDEQQMNNKRTTDEQQMNTNKNVKNVKNDNTTASSVHLFEEFWNEYNKKVDRRACEKKFKSIINSKDPDVKATAEEIINGAVNYKIHMDKEQTETKFRKNPLTFLNQQSFRDYQQGTGPGSTDNAPAVMSNEQIEELYMRDG